MIQNIAKLINSFMGDAHRGAYRWSENVVALFDNRYKPEYFIPRIVERCQLEGVRVLETCQEPTCVVLVECNDAEWLNSIVWQEWHGLPDSQPPDVKRMFYHAQRAIADSVIEKFAGCLT
jgi:hypothetical protein